MSKARADLENLKGRVKQAAGAVTGDKSLEAEGAVERAKGAAKSAVEKAKDKLAGDDEEEETTSSEEEE